MTVVRVTDSHLGRLATDKPAGSVFESDVASIHTNKITGIQALWSGVNAEADGSFELYVSLFPDPATFAPYPSSTKIISADRVSHFWDIDRCAFRFVQVRYTPNLTTAGLVQVYASSKAG